MKQLLLSIQLLLFTGLAFAQEVAKKPSDYLDMEFHQDRRNVLREKMPPNSVAVFFANPVRNRANDVQFMYHQDPNFYYLTGHREPHAVLLVFKDDQVVKDASFNEMIFVRAHDALREMYDGARLGEEGAKSELKIQVAYEGPDFKDLSIDFSKFDKVLFYDFEDDVRQTDEDGDLYDLISEFKQKVGYQSDMTLTVEPQKNNLDTETLDLIMRSMRGVKLEEELVLLKKAVNISAMAQREVMKAMRPGMSEMEIQGLHEYVFKIYQAEYEGYPSIVGAGHNGCVLHYIDNYKPVIENGELILMDLGAEYHGYTADVTRTIPVNGKFTEEQKLIYDIVYEAQEAAAQICKAGLPYDELYKATAEVVNMRLVELGLYASSEPDDMINPETGRNRYYPHGCCHHIGLDVHDKGDYDVLRENMVITIEPGIYIPEGSPADEKWWNIPVRIEDDYLITKDGCELLSDMAPRQSDEIEALMAESSAFDAIKMPSLDER